MAILWKKVHQDTTYEVRTAGKTRRLYSNGLLHSQINPNKAVTGYVWDLLMLPAFFFKKAEIKRVLVLGVGGGSVITLLQRFVRPKIIIGIELNPIHLYIAKRFFYMNAKSVQLTQADAWEWLQKYRGPAFDMVVDDVFAQAKDPQRAITASKQWIKLMHKHLAKNAVLVSNFISMQEFTNSAYVNEACVRKLFPCAFFGILAP